MRATTLDFRPALRVLTSEQVPPGEVVREGDFVLLRIAGAAPEGLALPAVDPPLEGIALERDGALTLIRVKVAPEVPFEASHEPGMLTVVFGELPAPELRGPVTPELYMRLFPAPAQDTGPEGARGGRPPAGPEGLRIGRATLRPYVSAAWVDADVFAFSSPVPVRDQYLQIGPGVTASMPVGHGLLSAEYEARLRYFSDIPEVGETSHLAGARLDLPLGSRTLLRLGHRYTRATLETTVVDPGREYFFDLSRFTYNESSALARVDLGARLWAEGDYEVGPGDVLDIAVFDNADLSRLPHRPDERLDLAAAAGRGAGGRPHGGRGPAQDHEPAGEGLPQNPQVEVKVREFQSQFVSVVGEVNSPGRKPIRGRMRLVDALLESGGFKASASAEVLITRTDGTFDDGKPSITRADLVLRHARRTRSTCSCRSRTATSSRRCRSPS